MIFKKNLHPCALDKSSLSIKRVKSASSDGFSVTAEQKVWFSAMPSTALMVYKV